MNSEIRRILIRHLKSDRSGRRDLLLRTLVGNMRSMAKGLDYVVASQIRLDLRRTRHRSCMVKGVGMLETRCEFMANFAIPDYLGLGKSVSRGFGGGCEDERREDVISHSRT